MRDADAIEPGTVVVIGDDSRLRTSSQSYDKRVAGVVTGAGSPRPGIILDVTHPARPACRWP